MSTVVDEFYMSNLIKLLYSDAFWTNCKAFFSNTVELISSPICVGLTEILAVRLRL